MELKIKEYTFNQTLFVWLFNIMHHCMLWPLRPSSSVSNHRTLILSLKITVAITLPQNGSHANNMDKWPEMTKLIGDFCD